MTATRSELQAWIDAYATPDAPDAQALADFLGIELAEPEPPVGQRRRSPSGVEVIKTFDGTHEQLWRVYRAEKPRDLWRSDDQVADWEVITDAPECDREHLPDGHVAIDLRDWPDATLRTALVSADDPVTAAARAELARRGES